MTQESPPPTPRQPPSSDETIKETFESIIIAFVLAFVFRAFVVEAFVIPTGSMAPTLLGEHVRVRCPDCGYRFDAEGPSTGEVMAYCPMTGHPIRVTARQTAAAGDRILVHKFLYRFTEPRRWDVVVFKNPSQPKVNYIKRLVGLPSESLYLHEGNVYVAPLDAQGEPDETRRRIARKTARPKVQRAVWQPIYHSDYVPIDPELSEGTGLGFNWQRPWRPEAAEAWDLTINRGRSYCYDGQGDGTLHFTFAHWPRGGSSAMMRMMYGYNQMHSTTNWYDYLEPIEDIRLAATVQPHGRDPLRLALRTTARTDGAPEPVAAVIEPDGRVRLIVGDPESGDVESYSGRTIPPLAERTATRVEFWFVDLEASIWVNGERVLRHAFDLDFTTVRSRPTLDPQILPQIAIEVQGGPATLHHVEVDRDLYYSTHGPSGHARGALVHYGSEHNRLDIGPDEFFCLGDNSPLSHDGRFWGAGNNEHVDPWIRHRMFHDAPFKDGLVPRDLMMGRASFVYWPAPYPLRRDGFGVLPNFGDMRFIH